MGADRQNLRGRLAGGLADWPEISGVSFSTEQTKLHTPSSFPSMQFLDNPMVPILLVAAMVLMSLAPILLPM
jgi:hypothetical protein